MQFCSHHDSLCHRSTSIVCPCHPHYTPAIVPCVYRHISRYIHSHHCQASPGLAGKDITAVTAGYAVSAWSPYCTAQAHAGYPPAPIAIRVNLSHERRHPFRPLRRVILLPRADPERCRPLVHALGHVWCCTKTSVSHHIMHTLLRRYTVMP